MGCNAVPLAALTKPQCATHVTVCVRVYTFMLHDDRHLSNTKQLPVHSTTNSVPYMCTLKTINSSHVTRTKQLQAETNGPVYCYI